MRSADPRRRVAQQTPHCPRNLVRDAVRSARNEGDRAGPRHRGKFLVRRERLAERGERDHPDRCLGERDARDGVMVEIFLHVVKFVLDLGEATLNERLEYVFDISLQSEAPR